ncbi:MAG: hypothetical protein IKF14_04695 [Atopobiaceae bacterium]|nr:hypothetical protein [Atopobiaceae bacterium]
MLGNAVYVLGGAQTDFERNWTKEGKSEVALLKEAVDDALLSAGITYGDISRLNEDGRVACFVGNFIGERYVDQGHLGALLTEVHPAFYGVPSARYEAACASGSVALDAAISKIRLDDYDLAIVVGWELMKTVSSKECGDILGRAAFYRKECPGVDFPFPTLFGQLAIETVNKYGLDRDAYFDDLAMISVINYENAKRNPLAQTRKWFMDYEEASHRGTETNPLVGETLGVADCSQVTDGAAVVFLASERMIQELRLKNLPRVKGFGHRTAPMIFANKMIESRQNNYILPWTRQAILDAYGRAGIGVEDVNVIETHDCFTSSEYVAISSFGITDPGNEFEAVRDGRIAFDGSMPINPSGGLIGCGHPVGASGVRMFLDISKQIAGTAGDYQVVRNGEIPENAAMLNIGGTATTNYVFIVGR